MVTELLYMSPQTIVAFLIFVLGVTATGGLVHYRRHKEDQFATIPLSIFIGIALWMVLASAIGGLGQFDLVSPLLLSILAIFAFLARRHYVARKESRTPESLNPRAFTMKHQIFKPEWLVSLIVFSYALRAFQSPHYWDDIMYHLPQTLAWWKGGGIVVNEAIRYPLFPMGPAAIAAWWSQSGTLLVGQCLSALAFTAVAFLIFHTARKTLPTLPSILVVIIWTTSMSGTVIATATVDMVLCGMVTGCVYAARCYFTDDDNYFVIIVGLLAGAAFSSKYQAALYLAIPLVAFFFLLRTHPARIYLLASFFLSCGFWYARAFVVSGDPLHPLGASIFGSWGWNIEDMDRQLNQLEGVRDWPPALLLSSLFLPIFWKRLTAEYKYAVVLLYLWFLSWMIVSGYPRYLVPAYPLMAILSAEVFRLIWVKISGYSWSNHFRERLKHGGLLRLSRPVFTAVCILLVLVNAKSAGKWIFVSEDTLIEKYSKRYEGFALLRSTDANITGSDGRTYQIALDNQNLLLGQNVIGDYFGRYRLKDFLEASKKEDGFQPYLAEHNIQNIIVNLELPWSRKFYRRIEQMPFLCELGRNDGAGLLSVAQAGRGCKSYKG
ncbi:conserved hypothetical protein [Luminiphilus syltensis NOR5-1B]|uniref:Glycosyltransferase RgtA/B/C/D-like domain-containing protein n=1 Tax=Luminiphilus syltensis NOR5-1B TaxID=565045 RepID=B8KVW2_9GAMM|nr:hypothetical protein [Luminiphilus syltensis]EED35972.1 conserved hypothetical protein [Luminiphilus syltensis NOR5-1B]